MKLLSLPQTLSEKIRRLLQPIRTFEPVTAPLDANQRGQWRCSFERLSSWLKDPTALDDEGVEAPAPSVLATAISVAEALRDAGIEPPEVVIPNGDGGVVFRWRSDQQAWSIELESDGSIDSYLLRDGKLVWRHSLHG